jgi:hypothetical protein
MRESGSFLLLDGLFTRNKKKVASKDHVRRVGPRGEATARRERPLTETEIRFSPSLQIEVASRIVEP